jgi:GT2 family glycosyltransferase
MTPKKQVVALMTTHNRSDSLELALHCLRNSARIAKVGVKVIVANSGTQKIKFPEAAKPRDFAVYEKLVPETTFWAKGMRASWEEFAASRIKADFVLWLNEDTFLDKSAIATLLNVANQSLNQSIVVGSTRSRSKSHTYGGQKRIGNILRLHFQKVVPDEYKTRTCQTFNGNCVLIPSKIDKELGGFPKNYSHVRADLAYGLLAGKRGVSSIVAPGYVAECEENLDYPSYRDLRGKGLFSRIKFLSNPKIGPLNEHIKFSLQFGGVLGPLYSLAPIVRILLAR